MVAGLGRRRRHRRTRRKRPKDSNGVSTSDDGSSDCQQHLGVSPCVEEFRIPAEDAARALSALSSSPSTLTRETSIKMTPTPSRSPSCREKNF
jgi:hypothetical protein